MSQTTDKPTLGAHAESSNRVQQPLVNRMLARPEIGASVAAVVIGIFFLVVAPAFRSGDSLFTVLYQSSTIGIVAVGVGLLMIGGEFDLSAGVIVTSAGLFNAMLSYELGLNLWVGAVTSLLFALAIGFLNGYLVMKTGIPSFLITLGTFFVLQGANLGVTKLVTGQVSSTNIRDIDGFDSLAAIFASSFKVGGVTVWGTVIWWVLFVALAAWVLTRTRTGNWIYAVGGAPDSARAVGVPVIRTKIGLFMTVSFLGWFVGMHILYRFNTLQAGNGVGNEFL
jgi:simple sugar transport system permease protein